MMRNSSNACSQLDRELICSALEGSNEKYQSVVLQLNKMNKQLETLQQALLALPSQIVQAMSHLGPMEANLVEPPRSRRQVSEIEKWICEMSMSPTSSLSSSFSDTTLERDFERLNFEVEDKEETEANNETMTTTTTNTTTTGLNKCAPPESKLFAHWQQHYDTTQSLGQGSKFLFGSFAPTSPAATSVAAPSATLLSTSTAPKILPYNANIDMSVWLK